MSLTVEVKVACIDLAWDSEEQEQAKNLGHQQLVPATTALADIS